MSLTVETGAIVADAESFASVSDFRSYFASIGTDATALTDAKVEQLLRLGTNYLEQKYRFRWQGYRVSSVQALSWPRAFVQVKDAISFYGNSVVYLPQNQVPKVVVWACCELAYRANGGDLLGDQKQQVLSEQVASLSVTYDKSSPQYTRYLMIDAWLEPYLKITGNNAQMVRV